MPEMQSAFVVSDAAGTVYVEVSEWTVCVLFNQPNSPLFYVPLLQGEEEELMALREDPLACVLLLGWVEARTHRLRNVRLSAAKRAEAVFNMEMKF